MTRFLAVFSAILLSTLSAGLFVVSSAHAASSYDNTVHVTDKLVVKHGSNEEDVTTTYIQKIDACNIPTFKDSLMNVVSNGGDWAILQQNHEPSEPTTNNPIQNNVVIAWADNMVDIGGEIPDSGFTGTSPNTSLYVRVNYYVSLYMDGSQVKCAASTEGTQSSQFMTISTEQQPDQSGNSTKLFLSTYPVTYPDGYSGIEIPSTFQPGTYPDFGYTVNNDLQLKILYLQNLDLTNGYKWSYTTYQSDSDWSPNTEIDSRSLRLNEIYEQQLPAVGNYVVKIHLESPPPLLDRNDIKNIELRITATGNYDVGSTVLNDCVDGVCTQKACVTGSVFDKMSCKLRNQINVGVLNPTINILVSLYQSMTVKQGVCTQLLPDSPSINGQALPFSQLSTKTCQWSDSIRGNPAFAWVTVMVNLLFAIMIFLGIKNLINKILDNKDDEVIQS